MQSVWLGGTIMLSMDDRTEPNNCTGTNRYSGTRFGYDIIWFGMWKRRFVKISDRTEPNQLRTGGTIIHESWTMMLSIRSCYSIRSFPESTQSLAENIPFIIYGILYTIVYLKVYDPRRFRFLKKKKKLNSYDHCGVNSDRRIVTLFEKRSYTFSHVSWAIIHGQMIVYSWANDRILMGKWSYVHGQMIVYSWANDRMVGFRVYSEKK